MSSVLQRNVRLPRQLTGNQGQSIALIVVGHVWLVAAVVIITFARDKSLESVPLIVFMIGYGLALPLIACGAWQARNMRKLWDSMKSIDRVLLAFSLLAAAYPALVFIWVLSAAK
jgi:hypothetical protein